MTRVTLLSFLSDVDVGDECFDAKPATVGDLKLNLPLDEDDYLMPSPQQTESTTTYMDIIGDKSTGEYKKKNDFVSATLSDSFSSLYHTCLFQTRLTIETVDFHEVIIMLTRTLIRP